MDKEELSKIIKIKPKYIKNKNIKYYWIDDKWCCDIPLKVMFDNVKPYEYIKPIKLLAEYYKYDSNDYYDKLAKRLSKFDKEIIDEFNEDIDNMVLQYVKCRHDIRIITFFKKINKKVITKYLSKLGYVYAIKYIDISKNAMKGLTYQLFSSSDKRNIKAKRLTIIVFESKNIHKKILDKIANNHISPTFNKAIEDAQIYFCENSLKVLDEQLFDGFNSPNMKKSYILFNTVKNVIFKNFSLLEMTRITITSGVVYYIYGIRNLGDIDIDVISTINDRFIDKVYYLFGHRKTGLAFTDAMYPTTKWKKYWSKHFYVDTGFFEPSFDPKYHFYFMGLRCVTLNLISLIRQRRIISRLSVKSVADLLATNMLLNKSYIFPKFQSINYDIGQPINLNKKLKQIQQTLKNYSIKLNKEQLLDKLEKYTEKNNEITGYILEKIPELIQ